MTATPVEEMSFEQAMAELEKVVGQLEQGQVPLEESITLYERGAQLKARCETKLKEAEEKVARLTLNADGQTHGDCASRRRLSDGRRDPMNFKAALAEAQQQAESCIHDALSGQDSDLADAMRYAVTGGKGLRAFLVIESARLHGLTDAAPAAAAIECLHAYSLVHDDLPCMDNDDLRRGQPTVHRKWNDTIAVLAGDALQSLAFDLVTRGPGSAEARLTLSRDLARAAGISGMVGGQMLDIDAETSATPLTLDQIMTLQAGKTGALIKWSATAGAVLAGADKTPLATYGDRLGLAFQIADDILDVTGDAAVVGKAVGKDADAGKATFVSLLGLDEAKRRAADLVNEACDALSIYGETADILRQAARFVITRTH